MITAKEANDFTNEKIQDNHRRNALKEAWREYCNYRKIKKELLPKVEKEIIKNAGFGSYFCWIYDIEPKNSPYLEYLLQCLGYKINYVTEQKNWDMFDKTDYLEMQVSWSKI